MREFPALVTCERAEKSMQNIGESLSETEVEENESELKWLYWHIIKVKRAEMNSHAVKSPQAPRSKTPSPQTEATRSK